MRACIAILCLFTAATALGAPDEPHLGPVTQLTKDAEFSKAGEAYFSPDGNRILFQAVSPAEHASPYYQIYVMNADGSQPRLVSAGQGKTTCAYFVPGTHTFIYASSHLDARTYAAPEKPKDPRRRYKWDYDGSFDIFLGDLETGKVKKRLTKGEGYDAEGSVSHDGKTICYTVRREGKPDQLWLMDVDGGNKRALVATDALACGGPFFSPDDTAVLYRAMKPGGRTMDVYLTTVDGATTTKLTRVARVNWAPFFLPDGKHVVYAASVDPQNRANFDVMLLKADGSGREVALTRDVAFDGLPTVSPDGKKLLWTSKRGGKESQVFVADLTVPPDSAFAVPVAVDPHGGGGGANPHGEPTSRPTSRPANPHGDEPTSRPAQKPADHGRATGIVEPRAGGEQPTPAGLEAIVAKEILEDIAWLADDARGGRRSGTDGAREAADYIRDRFVALGLKPGGPEKQWFQEFDFDQGGTLAASGNELRIDGKVWALGSDAQPLLYSSSAVAEGEVVFAGYGIRATIDHGYNDFDGVDLAGKIALVMTGGPRSQKGGAFGKDHPGVYQDLRYKIAACRDAGAVGVLLVRSKGEGWLELSNGDPGIPVAEVSAEVVQARLGISVARMVSGIDMHGAPASEATGKRARLAVKLERLRTKSRNVVGMIVGAKAGGDVLVIGAHYDHLGHGGEGSLAPGASAVHNGADDNASGVAGMLALAKAFSQAPPRRTVLFVAFGAEEEGLIGSKRFVAKFAKVAAMINMDMIGRLDGRKLLLGGYGSAKEWPAIVQHAVDATARAIAVQDDGFGPSDHASFYGEGVPVFFLWTGTHVDYHKPSDDTARIDEAGAEYCTRVAYHLARGIDARDALTYVKVPRKKSPRRVATGERRASFGSIPDYSQDGVVGVRLDGASAGGPAAKAGIKKGDVVVEFNGRKVVNIYDYTNALRESKPGETVSVVVERDGKRITLKATLVAR